MNSSHLKRFGFLSAIIGAGVATAPAADISLTANDPFGESSFNTSGTWQNAAPPSPGNDYFTGNFRMRTPADGNSYTFGGNSLAANNTPAADASAGIGYKGLGTNGVLTANWVLDGGQIYHLNGVTDLFQLAGTLTITPNGGELWAKQGDLLVLAPITGAGPLTIPATDAPAETGARFVNLRGNNSGYTGVITLIGKLSVIAEENLGGNPSTLVPNQLAFEGGILSTTNTFTIDDANRGLNVGASGTINVSNPDTNTVSVLTISSPLSGFGGLTKTGNGTLALSGANNEFFGGVTVSAGRLNLQSPTALGFGTLTLNAGALLDNASGGDITLVNNNPQTWTGNFSFVGTRNLDMGTGGAALNANVAVTVSNQTLTVGAITDDGGLRSLTKQGPGTLAINGGAFYGGSTFVNEGVLSLIGNVFISSPVVNIASNAVLNVGGSGLLLNSGQVLTGGGTVNGTVSDSAGATIDPGAGIGTLAVNGNLTLNGGTVNFQLSGATTPGAGVNDLVTVSGQLNAAGPATVNVIGTPAVGTYTLFDYGTFSGNLANLTVPPGFALNNNVAAGTIELVVTHVPQALTWQGDGTANVWDLGITPNFRLNGTPQPFFTGDAVTFDNTGSGVPPVNLAGDLSPSSVVVNSSQNYTFTGGGLLTGSLTKSGTGTLVLDNTNSYTGATVINGGILQLGDPAGMYAGAAGTLGRGPVTNNALLAINRVGTLTITNSIVGSGSLSNFAGSTVLSGSNSYTGVTVISGGSVQVAHNAALGATNGATIVQGSGQLNAFNARAIDENIVLNPADTTTMALRNGGNQVFTINGTVALNSDTAVQVDGGSTMVFSNQVSGPGALIKNVSGTLTLAGSNTFSGGLSINSGTLILANNNALGNSQVTLTSTTGGPGLSGTRVTLSGGVTIPATKSLTLPSSGSGTVRSALVGTGAGVTNVWSGPITLTGDSDPGNQVGFGVDANSTFVISGNVTADASFPGKINIRGNGTGTGILSGTVALAPEGQIQVDDGATWVIASTGNTWGTSRIVNGTLRLGANNALPTASVITDNSRFDLAGFNQAIAGLSAGVAITNSSLVADSTLTYATPNQSTFTGSVRDGARRLNLTIASGNLTLTSTNTLNAPRSTVTVNSGAVLQLDYVGTNRVAALVLNGVSQPVGFYSSANSGPFVGGTGVIQVANPVPTIPTTLGFSRMGNSLMLNWPAEYAGWILQAQTNSLSTGLATNWVDVAGSAAMTSTNIVIDPAAPAAFFRLRAP
ncbi:MAG TPA: autotransporter-associated beta strand repeat-containing protein [Verrucomicrobiae bacterium]|nr:autotransporter-associated beta strand repeat-containing protein [Verrucomicrobiae bacterium]